MAAKTGKPTYGKEEKKKKNSLLYCIVVFILTIVACFSGKFKTILDEGAVTIPDAEFQIHVIDVDQADSVLVVADGEAMLIDAAESSAANTILEYLKSQNITQLKYAVATHFHADHIGGMAAVLNGVHADTVLEPVCKDSLIPATRTYERYLDAVEGTGAKLKAVKAGDTFTLGGAEISVLAPVSEKANDLNNTSVVLRVEYNGVTSIFTGDMETPEEKTILESGAKLDADFLKVGHHGSDTSSGDSFLAAVTPQYAVISCGVDNSYGHPADVTLEKLAKYTKNVMITAQTGSVVFLYDKDSGTCNMIAERMSGEKEKAHDND